MSPLDQIADVEVSPSIYIP